MEIGFIETVSKMDPSTTDRFPMIDKRDIQH